MEHAQSHFSDQHYKASASGPFPFLNPTTRRFPIPTQARHKPTPQTSDDKLQDAEDTGFRQRPHENAPEGQQFASSVEHKWRSRDNRKGRHAITVTPASKDIAEYLTPLPTNTLKHTLRCIGRMFTTYPYWDVSYLVAIIFTIGSVVWCFNGFFVWLPLQDPSTEFPGEVSAGGGITAFLGATIFEIGSILLMIEAVNENRSDCFGWALEESIEEKGLMRLRPDYDSCKHHHRNRHSLLGHGKASKGKPPHGLPMESKDHSNSKNARSWTWFPTWHELKTHYFHEIGFLACFFQMLGASIFWISGFTALPGIYENLSPEALNGAYWSVQVIGGSGFIISSILFMLETQQKWYLPAPKVLGWHIGLWNLIGALGFTLCGALGFSSGKEELYQSALATFWGSWAFLIGSVIQWFESLNKHPVDVEEGGGRIANTQPVKPE